MSSVTADKLEDSEPELLFAAERPNYRLELWLKNHQLECYGKLELGVMTAADADPGATGKEPDASSDKTSLAENDPAEILSSEIPTPAELICLLQYFNINETIDFEGLYGFCAAAAEGVERQEQLLAKGVLPQPGKDGWFEMSVKTTGDRPEFQEDEKGKVDLRTQHRFTEIEPGQRLGIVHAPKEGVPGMTVTGLPIPAESGNPFNLIAGEGVILKYDDRVAFAEKAGRALLYQRILSIVDQLVINGDLDLRTGNIDFHGFVEIKGDVPDDYLVKASRGMQISGTVGASLLESGGPMEIGSMAGKEKGEIKCHGDLKAGYLNQVRVTCYGNVLVSNEIRNSQVKATGRIFVERGAIVGGKCVAMEGIEAKVFGSDSGLRTQLVAGIYFPDADRFDYLHERLKIINRQLKKIHEAIGPLEKIAKLEEALEKASEMRMTILNQQWEKLELEKEQCASELTASRHQVFSSRNPKINVLKAIKEGVVVTLGDSTEEFKFGLSGPMSLIENVSAGGLRHLSLSPLSKLATVIEDEIRGQEEKPAKS